MNKYYTIFLARYESTAQCDVVFTFVEWLLSRLSFFGRAKINAVRKWGISDRPRRLSKQELVRNRELANSREAERIYLRVPGNSPGRYAFYVYFQVVCPVLTADYLTLIDPTVPSRSECPDGLRILSISIDKAMYERTFRFTHARSELHGYVEQLFAQMKCVYGYGTETAHVISGRFLRIKDHGGGGLSEKTIADFDYTRYVEGVYNYNLLSKAHVTAMGDLASNLKDEDGIEVRNIYSQDAQVGGMAVYLNPHSPENINRATPYFQPLFETVAEAPVKTRHFLLIHKEGISTTMLEQILGQYPSKAMRVLPYDFVQVEQIAPATAYEARRGTASMQKVYRQIYPTLMNKDIYAHEYLEQFCGLFDRRMIFARVVGLGRQRADFAKVRFTGEIDFERLEMTFLVHAQPTLSSKSKMHELIHNWCGIVRNHNEEYGKLEILEELRDEKIRTKHRFHLTVNAADLRQDAVNLLVLMVDEVNQKECMVPYIVFGRLRL
ncbi:MAG: hypothetical protein ACYTEX_25040 [Planctomycetota bacterium]|jgi:hypothetical protein